MPCRRLKFKQCSRDETKTLSCINYNIPLCYFHLNLFISLLRGEKNKEILHKSSGRKMHKKREKIITHAGN